MTQSREERVSLLFDLEAVGWVQYTFRTMLQGPGAK